MCLLSGLIKSKIHTIFTCMVAIVAACWGEGAGGNCDKTDKTRFTLLLKNYYEKTEQKEGGVGVSF
jgi:hypothetical protein